MSFADILSSETAGARLKEAAERVEAAATPSFWEGVGIWFSSFGDPDDVIGFKVLFFVAVNGELADVVDAQMSSLPPEVVGRALRSGPLDVDLRRRRRDLPRPLERRDQPRLSEAGPRRRDGRRRRTPASSRPRRVS